MGQSETFSLPKAFIGQKEKSSQANSWGYDSIPTRKPWISHSNSFGRKPAFLSVCESSLRAQCSSVKWLARSSWAVLEAVVRGTAEIWASPSPSFHWLSIIHDLDTQSSELNEINGSYAILDREVLAYIFGNLKYIRYYCNAFSYGYYYRWGSGGTERSNSMIKAP